MPPKASKAKGNTGVASKAVAKAALSKAKQKTSAPTAGKSKTRTPQKSVGEAFANFAAGSLRNELKSRGLATNGLKDELIKRLVSAVGEESGTIITSPVGTSPKQPVRAGRKGPPKSIASLESLDGVRAVMKPRAFDPKSKVGLLYYLCFVQFVVLTNSHQCVPGQQPWC